MDGFVSIIAERRAESPDGIVSRALSYEVATPVSDEDLLSFCLMFMAGLATEPVSLGWSFRRLAPHPADRARIVRDEG
jgi:cytochrome P450